MEDERTQDALDELADIYLTGISPKDSPLHEKGNEGSEAISQMSENEEAELSSAHFAAPPETPETSKTPESPKAQETSDELRILEVSEAAEALEVLEALQAAEAAETTAEVLGEGQVLKVSEGQEALKEIEGLTLAEGEEQRIVEVTVSPEVREKLEQVQASAKGGVPQPRYGSGVIYQQPDDIEQKVKLRPKPIAIKQSAERASELVAGVAPSNGEIKHENLAGRIGGEEVFNELIEEVVGGVEDQEAGEEKKRLEDECAGSGLSLVENAVVEELKGTPSGEQVLDEKQAELDELHEQLTLADEQAVLLGDKPADVVLGELNAHEEMSDASDETETELINEEVDTEEDVVEELLSQIEIGDDIEGEDKGKIEVEVAEVVALDREEIVTSGQESESEGDVMEENVVVEEMTSQAMTGGVIEVVSDEEDEYEGEDDGVKRGAYVEVVYLGNLPGVSGPWLTQYAQLIAQEEGAVALLHVDGEQIDLELIEPIDVTNRGVSAREPRRIRAKDSLNADLVEVLDELITMPAPVRTILLHLDAVVDDDAYNRGDVVDEVTICCGSDDTAVMSSIEILRNLAEANPTTIKNKNVGLMVMGSDQDSSRVAASKILAQVTGELGCDVQLAGWQQQMMPVSVSQLGSYLGTEQIWVNLQQFLSGLGIPDAIEEVFEGGSSIEVTEEQPYDGIYAEAGPIERQMMEEEAEGEAGDEVVSSVVGENMSKAEGVEDDSDREMSNAEAAALFAAEVKAAEEEKSVSREDEIVGQFAEDFVDRIDAKIEEPEAAETVVEEVTTKETKPARPSIFEDMKAAVEELEELEASEPASPIQGEEAEKEALAAAHKAFAAALGGQGNTESNAVQNESEQSKERAVPAPRIRQDKPVVEVQKEAAIERNLEPVVSQEVKVEQVITKPEPTIMQSEVREVKAKPSASKRAVPEPKHYVEPAAVAETEMGKTRDIEAGVTLSEIVTGADGILAGGFALEAYCPKQKDVELVLDQEGGLHLLGMHDSSQSVQVASLSQQKQIDQAALQQVVLNLIEARQWASEHIDLLQMTQRQLRFAINRAVTIHLFTDRADLATSLITRFEDELRLHLLKLIDVGGDVTVFSTPLN